LKHGYNIFGFDGQLIDLSSSKAKFMFLFPVPEVTKPGKTYWNSRMIKNISAW
jgi:hypothetical protein